ncbi:MAG: DUF4493 domain-containing protein [Alistipes sp.]|nr:DUF4493 domain-containing protein [Candidatus Minthomonas equi]
MDEVKVSFDTKSLRAEAVEIGLTDADIDSFNFSVTDSDGVVYDGTFGECPETVTVKAGQCFFSLRSRFYSGPEINSPIYGDDEVIMVEAGEEFEVRLSCRQLTVGVQVLFSDDFEENFPEGFIRLSCRDTLSGKVEYADYPYSEDGFCHFMPGIITVNLMKDGDSSPEFLTGRYCSASDMFSVSVKIAPMEAYGTVKVSADTVRLRYKETYLYGRKRCGLTMFDAVQVTDLGKFDGDTVWVIGYISGCFVNKKWHPEIDSMVVTANIALSPSLNSLSAWPISIASGKCKEMNLKEYPQFFGERVAVRGIAGTLYDMDGMKKSLEYVLL